MLHISTTTNISGITATRSQGLGLGLIPHATLLPLPPETLLADLVHCDLRGGEHAALLCACGVYFAVPPGENPPRGYFYEQKQIPSPVVNFPLGDDLSKNKDPSSAGKTEGIVVCAALDLLFGL